MFATLAPVEVKSTVVQLAGGLDLVSSPLEMAPGALIDGENYVLNAAGGYTRVGGYERSDGRPRPSDQDYFLGTFNRTDGIALNATLTGVSSGATAKVVRAVDSRQLVLTRRSAPFTPGELVRVGAQPMAQLISMVKGGATTVPLDALYRPLAADDFRTDILAMPGSGPTRGVWVYKGVVYGFRDNVEATACLMYRQTAGGWVLVTTPALTAGGNYRFVNYNFTGSATGLLMFGCDGVNKAFQFDGTTFTQITTTATPDTPSYIAAHRNRLFAGILGSLFVSAAGSPVTGWTGVGAIPAEVGIGDTITGLQPLGGDGNTGAMAVFARNRTSVLYGSSASTFALTLTAPDAGALPGTVQFVSAALALDDRGATMMQSTQDFGNFQAATFSAKVQPFLEARKLTVTTSSVLRSQNQYRLYFSDGAGLVFRIENQRSYGATRIKYAHPVRCICSAEDTNGNEVVYFGSDDGFVYQAEKGTSFDGQPIKAWARLSFNSVKSPDVNKHWQRAVVNLRNQRYVQLSVAHEQDYSNVWSQAGRRQTKDLLGAGGYWDQFTWDSFVWDSPVASTPKFKLSGSSPSISLLFFSNDALSLPWTLDSVILYYTPRKLRRGR